MNKVNQGIVFFILIMVTFWVALNIAIVWNYFSQKEEPHFGGYCDVCMNMCLKGGNNE